MARQTERLEAEIAVRDNATDAMDNIIRSNQRLNTEMLRLRENMNRMRRSAQERTQMRIETARARQNVENLKQSIDHVKNSAGHAMRSLKTLGVVAGTAIAAGFGIAIKSGLELEKQMASIQHFIGVNNKSMNQQQTTAATEKYIQEMRKYATATPFSSSDVMAAGSRAVGVAGGNTTMANELVKVAGDMAALTPGKTMMDAMEALADAKTGEMERLKEFGFKVTADEFKGFVGKGAKDNLTDAETNKAYSTLVNKKLNPYFGGGAEKISKTTGGKISTIQGNISSGLQDAGYNMMKGIDPKLLDGLVQASAKLGETLGGLGAKMINAFAKVKPHISAIGKSIVIATAAVVGFKLAFTALTTMRIIITLFKAWRAGTYAATVAQLGLTSAMLLSPFTWIAIAIAAVVAAGVALYLNWDKVKAKCKELWETTKKYFKKLKESALDTLQPLLNLFGKLGDKWDNFKKSITSFKMPKIGVPKWLGGDGFIQKASKKSIGGVIPRDNYPAILHRGERVQTMQEVHQDNRKQSGNSYQFGDIIIQGSGNSKQDAKSIMDAIVREIEMAGGAGA